jgi:hypothetical protein
MRVQKLPVAVTPLFSKNIIKKYTQILKEKVAGKQHDGKLPNYKKVPKSVVEISDIKIIFGRSDRTAQRHMSRIRKALGKKKGEFVSVKEFCEVTGMDEFTVQQALNVCT